MISIRLRKYSAAAVLLALIAVQAASGQPSPLDGTNFIGAYGHGLFTIASVDPGLIPSPNESFSLSAPGGAGTEFSLAVARFMPSLFLSTSTTAELRLSYMNLSGSSSGFGVVQGVGGSDQGRSVRQTTTARAQIAAMQARLTFDTDRMAKASPTVSIGMTFGHVLELSYETQYDPDGVLETNDQGLPEGTFAPEHRDFYGAIHIGGGGRISLGDAATSMAIVPEIELVIPVTSLAAQREWLPFGVRLGAGLRFPL